MIRPRHWVWVAGAAAVMVALSAAPAQAHHRTGTEPTLPYAQPASPPKRGCATVANPTAPTGSIPALQVIYAWHDGDGDHYEESVEQIAGIVDRIDWSLDESSNYDQHINLSCRYADNGSYADYARALVVPEKIEAGANPMTTSATVRADLHTAGYTDSNRYYLVFTDFESESDAFLCPTSGGTNCSAVVELWDSGVAGHELLHVFGAGHAWSAEVGQAYFADLMYGWWDYWMVDQDFNTYYDPSETTASFYIDPYPSTTTHNVARHPALTAPVCCDVGFSNDLLTAQERTIEANNPGTAPTGFTFGGGGSMSVAPACGVSAVSCKYYDGRRSIQVNAVSSPQTVVSVTRRPAVTAGQTYKFFTRMRSDAVAKNVRLRLSWYTASNTLISNSDSPTIAVTSGWDERAHQAVAPANATKVQVRVIVPTGQGSFSYQLDSLLLNHCNPTCRPNV